MHASNAARRALPVVVSFFMVLTMMGVSPQGAPAASEPAINVSPQYLEISGSSFAPFATVTATNNGVSCGSVATIDSGSFGGLRCENGIEAGDVVVVTAGSVVRQVVVSPLAVTGITGNVIAGIAGAGPIHLWTDDWTVERNEVVALDGSWSADVGTPGDEESESGTTTIGPSSSGAVEEYDEDGDRTTIFWRAADWQPVRDPTFSVDRDSDDIVGSGFTASGDVTIDVTRAGASIDWISMPADESGSIFYHSDSDIVAGDWVVLSDAIGSKDTIVGTTRVTDVTGTVISGVSDMEIVWLAGTEGQRAVSVLDGSWSTDVGQASGDDAAWSNLEPGMRIAATTVDVDGDSTIVGWLIGNAPTFRVFPGHDSVSGMEFRPESAVSISVTRDSSVVATELATTNPQGGFWVDFSVDIAAGDIVTVADASAIKETTVTALQVTGLDTDSDLISGTASAGTIDLWIPADNVERTGEPVDVSGLWLVDLTQPGTEYWEQGVHDLKQGSSGEVTQLDEDGDATIVEWRVSSPAFNVSATGERGTLNGWDFLPDATLTVELVRSDVQLDSVQVQADASGAFWYEFPDLVLVGDVITVRDRMTTKVTVVRDIRVTGLDLVADVVSGTAAANSAVGLSVTDVNVERVNEPVDPDGNWAIDVRTPGADEGDVGTTDLVPGSSGSVYQLDEDGDATVVSWEVANPHIQVDVTDDIVRGWAFGGPVTITVVDPDTNRTRSWSVDPISAEDDAFELDLDRFASDGWDVAGGQQVTVVGPSVTRVLQVADLAVASWDLAANALSGTTDQPSTIGLTAQHAGAYGWLRTDPTAGAWAIDFDDSEAPYQLRILDQLILEQPDDDGDSTVLRTALTGPRFAVDLVTQEIIGFGWPDDGTVRLYVNGTFVASTSGADAPRDLNVPLDGSPDAYFDLTTGSPLVLVRGGDTVRLTDGTTEKTQVIPDLSVGLVLYPDRDELSGGTTQPEEGGFLVIQPDWDPALGHEVTTSPEGWWSTSFADEYDIVVGSGFAIQVDADGDQTAVATPQPRLIVDPASDRVWVLDFPDGTVNLVIFRQDAIVHESSAATQNVLYGSRWLGDMWTEPTGTLTRPLVALFDLSGVFDIQPGDQVGATIVAGPIDYSIFMDVALLTVDSVNGSTDAVAGQAATDVALNLDEGAGYWGYLATPEAGQWSYHFDPGVFPNVGLDPGMVGIAIADPAGGTAFTVVRWVVPMDTLTYDFVLSAPFVSPPTINAARAGRVIPIKFSLGGDFGLDVLEGGAPTVDISCSTGVPVEATTSLGAGKPVKPPKPGALTFSAQTGLYTYAWRTDRTWAGTCRQLIFSFDDGSQYQLNFSF